MEKNQIEQITSIFEHLQRVQLVASSKNHITSDMSRDMLDVIIWELWQVSQNHCENSEKML